MMFFFTLGALYLTQKPSSILRLKKSGSAINPTMNKIPWPWIAAERYVLGSWSVSWEMQTKYLWALKDARSSYKPTIIWTADFWSRLRCWKCLERGFSRCLTDEVQRRFGLWDFSLVKSVWHVVLSRLFHSLFLRHFLRWTHAARCRMAKIILVTMVAQNVPIYTPIVEYLQWLKTTSRRLLIINRPSNRRTFLPDFCSFLFKKTGQIRGGEKTGTISKIWKINRGQNIMNAFLAFTFFWNTTPPRKVWKIGKKNARKKK